MNGLSGVKGYLTLSGTVSNSFPIMLSGVVKDCCEYCRFYRRYDNECILTGERIVEAKTYRGGYCPLETEGELTDDNIQNIES